MDYPVLLIDQLPQQLRALRKSRKWSQAELAKRLGVTQARVATIERNPSVVSVGQLFEIVQLLGAMLVLRDSHAPAPLSRTVMVPAESRTVVVPPEPYEPKGEW